MEKIKTPECVITRKKEIKKYILFKEGKLQWQKQM